MTQTFTVSPTVSATSDNLSGQCNLKISAKTQLLTWPVIYDTVIANVDFSYTFSVFERYVDGSKAEWYHVEVATGQSLVGIKGWVKTSTDNTFFLGNCMSIPLVVPPTRTPTNTPSTPNRTASITKTATPTFTKITTCQLRIINPNGAKLHTERNANSGNYIPVKSDTVLIITGKFETPSFIWYSVDVNGDLYWIIANDKDSELAIAEVLSLDDCRGLTGFPPQAIFTIPPLNPTATP